VRGWGELPPGVAKWPAVTAVEASPNGKYIFVVERCFANSCAGRSEPPIIKYDKGGKIVATFGQGLFRFPHGAESMPGETSGWHGRSAFQLADVGGDCFGWRYFRRGRSPRAGQ
jgi:hypothetical protein